MLTSANVTANMAASYYEADNYYTAGDVLSPAVWTGRFARDLGLHGELEPRNFEQMLRGFGPDGKPLIDRPEYPSPEKRTVSLETRKETVRQLRSLLETGGVTDVQRMEGLERALSRKLAEGELSGKSVKSLSGKIGRVLDEAGAINPSVPDQQEALKAILSTVAAPADRRAALDLTFSAPKSVSLQALVFGDVRLVEAHRAAVLATLHHVETRFAQCRVGSKSDRQIEVTGKLAVAQFEHDLSREKDPHLHTHNVVINMTFADGKVRALHNDELFQNKRMLGTMYRNELALRARELGYDIELGKEGTFELGGYSRDQIEAFSKRHQQMWESGATSQAEMYERFHEGRKAKDQGLDRHALKSAWRETAESFQLQGVVAGLSKGAVLGAPTPAMQEEVRSLTEKSVSFRLQDLQTARLASQLGRADSKSVLAECQAHAAEELVTGRTKHTFTTNQALAIERSYRAEVETGVGASIPLAGPQQAAALRERLEAANGLTQEAGNEGVRLAMAAVQGLVQSSERRGAIEQTLRTVALSGAKQSPNALYALRTEVQGHLRGEGHRGKELAAALRTVLDPFEKRVQAMTEGQIAAVCKTAASTDAVILWQGVAGAGKTFSMTQVADLAKQRGVEVIGLAPSAAAAKQLSAETGLPAQTVDAHLLRGSRESVPDAASERLWIVDEAGMLSAKNFNALVMQARQDGARLLLVGDTRQLASVEAGNPFLDLQRTSKTTIASLSESVRQRTPELQDVVRRLYTGRAKEAVQGLRRESVEADTREERCAIAAKAFLALPKVEQERTLVLAKTNEERRLITSAVRDGLKSLHRLGAEAQITALHGVDFTELQKKQSHLYRLGYVVKPNDDLARGIRRGQTHVVVDIDLQGNALRLKDASGNVRTVPCENMGRASLYRPETLTVAKGDKIIWTRNDRAACALNNDLFEVSKVSGKNVTLRPLGPGTESRPANQVLAREGFHHIDHAWAMTVHRSQGQTAKSVILLADERTSANEFLVGVTRATQGVLLVTHDKSAIERMAARVGEKSIAHEVASPMNSLRQNPYRDIFDVEPGKSNRSITTEQSLSTKPGNRELNQSEIDEKLRRDRNSSPQISV